MIRYLRLIFFWSILFVIPNVCMSANKDNNSWYNKFFKKKSSETVIMQKEEKQQIEWEYCCDILADEKFLKKWRNNEISESELPAEMKKAFSLPTQEKFLNKKGSERWELISVEFVQVSTLFALTEKFPLYIPIGYFKRPKNKRSSAIILK